MSIASSTTPYWGRSWELDVYTDSSGSGTPTIISSSAWQPEALRVTFDIQQNAIPSAWWFADICVYNANAETIQQALFNAQWVVLKAGYQSATTPSLDGSKATSLTVIWSGAVMQALYSRENVTDNKITYHCLAMDPKESRLVNFSMGRNATQAQVVARMAGLVPSATPQNELPETLQSNAYLRSRVYFGQTDKYFGRIASGNNMQWFKGSKGTYLGDLVSPSQTPDIVYSPPMPPPPLPANWNLAPSTDVSYTLLDTPRQIDSGVEFRVLLDPRLIVQTPPLLVKLDNAVIEQMKLSYPQASGIYPLVPDNSYVVASVRHCGDTRGNEWSTEVTGYTRAYALLGARGIFLTGGQ